jgi:putative transposase
MLLLAKTRGTKVLNLFLAGLTEGQIRDQVQELYGGSVSTELVSEITDALLDEMDLWQHRPLEALYPVMWVDGFVVKIRHQNAVQNRTVYVVLGLKPTGKKELLGFWVDGAEGTKFWLRVLQELRQRGVKDVLIGCMDGLTGFPQAWKAVFPETVVQTCVVHVIRNSLEYVPYKERKAVASGLKPIYTAENEQQAEQALTHVETIWTKYSSIGRMWRRWEEFCPFLAYPTEIRQRIYTTNRMESVHQQFRRVVDQRGYVTTERGALKALFVVVKRLERKWTMPIKNWGSIRQQFAILFPNRFSL